MLPSFYQEILEKYLTHRQLITLKINTTKYEIIGSEVILIEN
jgi:hypothetical protein